MGTGLQTAEALDAPPAVKDRPPAALRKGLPAADHPEGLREVHDADAEPLGLRALGAGVGAGEDDAFQADSSSADINTMTKSCSLTICVQLPLLRFCMTVSIFRP